MFGGIGVPNLSNFGETPNPSASYSQQSFQQRQQQQAYQQQQPYYPVENGAMQMPMQMPSVSGFPREPQVGNAVEKQEFDHAIRNMSHFQRVVFELDRFNRKVRATMLFAKCKPENTIRASGTFRINLNDEKFTSASFMLGKDDLPHCHKQMMIFLKNVVTATGKSEEKGCVPASTTNVIVQSVVVSGAKDNLSFERPISITIDGVSDKFVQNHRCSYNDKSCSGVIFRDGPPQVMYSTKSAPSMLEGFHGAIDKIEPKTKDGKSKDYSAWGPCVDDVFQVPIFSDKCVFLCYNLYDLIYAYWSKLKAFPPGMTEDKFKIIASEFEKFTYVDQSGQPVDNGVGRGLYGVDADLTDGFMGRIIDILNEGSVRGEVWTQASNTLHINIPMQAVHFFADKYNSHIEGIVLTSPEKIKLQAGYYNDSDDEVVVDPKKNYVHFSAWADVFVPRMFYWIEALE